MIFLNLFQIFNNNPVIEDYTDSALSNGSLKPAKLYIDKSSKSTGAILFRFFESLDKKLSPEQFKNILCAMTDDLKKSNFVLFSNDEIIISPEVEKNKRSVNYKKLGKVTAALGFNANEANAFNRSTH